MFHRHEQFGPLYNVQQKCVCTTVKIKRALTQPTCSRSPGFSCPDLSINWHFSAESNFQQHPVTSPACLRQFGIFFASYHRVAYNIVRHAAISFPFHRCRSSQWRISPPASRDTYFIILNLRRQKTRNILMQAGAKVS